MLDREDRRRLPVTVVLGGVLLGLMVAVTIRPSLHAVLAAHLGVDWDQLVDGRAWRLTTSSLVQDGGGIVWPIVALLACLPLAERRFGSWFTLGLYVVADMVSTVVPLAIAAAVGDPESHDPNIGSSAGLVGLLAAWVVTLEERPVRNAALAVLVVALAGTIVVDPELASTQHAVAAAVGVVAGSSWAHRTRRSSRP